MNHCHQTLTRTSVFLKTSAYTITFFHSDTFYGQRFLSLKSNGKVHLHLIVQYEKIRTFLDPIREKIGRSRGTNKRRSLDEFIRCRINVYIGVGIYVNIYIRWEPDNVCRHKDPVFSVHF